MNREQDLLLKALRGRSEIYRIIGKKTEAMDPVRKDWPFQEKAIGIADR